MANLSSSKKMVRKIATRTARNKSHVTNMRTYIKKVEEAIASGNADEAKSALKEAQPKIMRVAQKGIFHKNTCLLYTSPSPRDRQKSRMPSSA